ncbi:glycosyltransferase [Thermoleophilum album]|uniref:Glycosyltransferase, GT2 family n=1 Tax=Thermoleophilum album TaxID=29539 RepID=A0A1H6FHH3_THEAL|nr:glycosyltransferase [Thermoleophilum album]SEH10281.1 Glycosyltransferase, GT2 family [Thermoleophilum album]
MRRDRRAVGKVVINARAAARLHVGGVERVASEMASRLPRLRPERYRVLQPPASWAHRRGHLWEQLYLPLAAGPGALIYCPANLAPVVSRRNVLVVHDLAPLRHPDWYSSVYSAYQRVMLPLLARRALHVVTPSEFSRRELIEELGLRPDRITVVPNGVDERFGPHARDPAVRAQFGLERPFVLVVGTRIARKNLGALELSAERLRALGVDLVAAGSGRHYMRPGRIPAIRALGYVDDRYLPALYAEAAAFVLPSLYEGFGIPILEAMASGTPVVCSNRSALPETCGDAALLVDPTDAEQLADGLLRVLTDEDLRATLVRRGLARARQFSWERAARLTDALIDGLLAEALPAPASPAVRSTPGSPREGRAGLRPDLLSVVVINCNRRDLLERCLASLVEACRRTPIATELVVVDNGSRDGSRELVRSRFPSAKLLELERNEGFAGGMAHALAAVEGEWVAVFNNDTTVAPDALRLMLEAARSAPDVGAVAAQMRFADRPGLVNSAGMEMDRLGVAEDRLVGRPIDDPEVARPAEVFGATGGAALFRRRMLEEVGGFDPSYFAFFEDADLAWRARARGWRALYEPRAVVIHHHSATARHGSPQKLYLVGRNRVRTLAKNAPASLLLRSLPGILLYDLSYVAYAAIVLRSLAPLRGRLAGLREWRRYRRAGAPYRGRVRLRRPLGIRRALERHHTWQREPGRPVVHRG